MSELALKLIREAKETRATRLDLGNCGLTELPDELFELTWLEELMLCQHETYFGLGEKIIYQSVNRGKLNQISHFPDNIKRLDKLKILLCGGVPGKEWLLFDLSPLVFMTNLEVLAISYSHIQDIQPLQNLINLKQLNLGHTKVKNIDPLKNIKELQFLDLYAIEIKKINPVAGLPKLNRIQLAHSQVTNLSPLKSIRNLQEVLFSHSKVTDLNPLKTLHSLESIFAAGCKITDLSPLSNLKNLTKLQISSTKVEDISPLEGLTNLQFLGLENTGVKDLSPLKKNIQSGSIRIRKPNSKFSGFRGIYFEGCHFNNPPQEIINQGNGAVLSYWKQKERQGTVELYEAKLIIVGEGETGKTTLFEKLKDNNHNVGKTPETHGINIHEGLPFKHKLVGDNIFNANLWDFGGQELQYMTHQFFLTPRALYVLMMDARKESPNLSYWFKIISLLGRDSADSTEKVRLLLVFNKRGNSTGTPPQYQDQLKYYADSLDVQYLEVDFAENDYRFDNLQNCIQQSLVTLPIVKSQLPRLWKVVREDLREEAKTENYIDTKRFSAICSKHGITEEADQWLLSGYLHQLGSLLHFQNDKGLQRLVILSPQWATDGVYTFLSNESIVTNKGKFTNEAFIKILAAKDYRRDDASVILQLMTKNNFDICYEATEGNYVAAQLLPDNRPENFFWEKRFGALQFRFQYPIMPKGLMSRLIVRLSDFIEKRDDEEVVWKKGAILSIPTDKNNPNSYCRVLMYEDNAESKSGLRQIIFEIMGDPPSHRKRALQRIREEVDSLHKKWFRSIKADEMVPCCCSECESSDNPQLYKLENLLKLKEKRQITICYSSGDDVHIQQLLEGVYDKVEIRDKENQGRY